MLGGDLDTLGAVAVYAVVIGFVFVEYALLVGFFLPGDTLLFAAGLVAADAGRGVHIGWLLAGVFAAVIAATVAVGLLRRRQGSGKTRHDGR